ncbi:hypothetical protein B0J17DRAFT_677909 [Rhizoctonia solani]|nr:hypothetical protein B0J17DRAFT_677909 [Rhizoctonia solani]
MVRFIGFRTGLFLSSVVFICPSRSRQRGSTGQNSVPVVQIRECAESAGIFGTREIGWEFQILACNLDRDWYIT